MGERVEGEENGPYRRVTLEWYRDLETGTFLAKLTIEGESVKEGKREAVFAFSVNEKIDIDSLISSEPDNVLNGDVFDSLINYIGAELTRSIIREMKSILGEMKSESVIDSFIDGFIRIMAQVTARGAMVFDANKLKITLSEEKS